jgi:hypothetical protein
MWVKCDEKMAWTTWNASCCVKIPYVYTTIYCCSGLQGGNFSGKTHQSIIRFAFSDKNLEEPMVMYMYFKGMRSHAFYSRFHQAYFKNVSHTLSTRICNHWSSSSGICYVNIWPGVGLVVFGQKMSSLWTDTAVERYIRNHFSLTVNAQWQSASYVSSTAQPKLWAQHFSYKIKMCVLDSMTF